MIKLTHDEWLEKYGIKLKDSQWSIDGNQWQTAQEMESDFQKFHGLSLQNEIDEINQLEYQLYLERFDAGVEE